MKHTHLNIPGMKTVKEGKVRTIYHLEDDTLLIVVTDRISAFDVVLPSKIPDKGKVLTQVSNFWFNTLKSVTFFIGFPQRTLNYPGDCRNQVRFLNQFLHQQPKPIQGMTCLSQLKEWPIQSVMN